MSVAEDRSSTLIRESKDKLQKDCIYEFQLEAEREKILREKPSNWSHLEQNGFTVGLKEKEIGLLCDFEEATPEDRSTMMGEEKDGKSNGNAIARMFLTLVGKVGNPQIKKYFLARIDQVLSEDTGCAKFFNACEDPYQPFIRVFSVRSSIGENAESEMMSMFACRILSKLFGSLEKWYLNSMQETKAGSMKLQSTIEQPMNDFIVLLNNLCRSKNCLIPLKALKNTLKQEKAHEPFIRDGGVRMLAGLMEPGANQEQIQYLAGFCVWILTFNTKMLRQIDQSDTEEKTQGLIKNMVATVRTVQREKVIRICFAAFRNMLKSDELQGRMVGLGLLDVIKTLNQTEDKELKENVEKVRSALKTFLGHLSTFEKYTTEVMSGQLQKSAVHNETFWRKNSAMFEKESYRHIRKLVELLDSKELETLEMACYDLGEFARFHPDGRSLVTRMGGKGKIMRLMMHRDETVAKQALLAIQKLMVSNWEFLTKS
uniref:V-type proton ATPase subunit H n=1 Tax=Lotharella oceanica TaxID=641309 RepID=A0A7S2TEE6_9EUKA|mmetsp:Transcript_10197/g.19602  ORF Transcript_10197/g.19602 Transcript_10197/m.19602 type:complete len:486 (+) Transcript_10197:25-1482(+)